MVDRPEIERGVVRVSGPFTVEAVMPPIERLDLDEPSPIDEPDAELETFGENGESVDGVRPEQEPANAEAYLDTMLRLLKSDGVRFPNNKQMRFVSLHPLPGDVLHAEGEWLPADEGDGQTDGTEPRRVAVSVGPQYGPVTASQVEQCLWQAARRGYDDLVLAGFSFDGAAQAAIQDDPNPRVRVHQANIRPDVNMTGLLKETPNSQLFTVFGLPRTQLARAHDGQWTVTMEGVDVYDPVANIVASTGASKVAAWFVDTDYDGRTFCICQAFFPDRAAWDKLARALRIIVDPEAFDTFSGITTLPFPTGDHKRVAVKVIDPRGNEVMSVHALTPEAVHA